MPDLNLRVNQSALEDFRRARSKANMQEIVARLRGKPVTLLSFEDTRLKLKAQVLGRKVIKDIPLEAIIGSVNRYEDFTRDFLPRKGIDGNRWAGVKAASYHQLGLPPIEAYQIGEAYFVSDGNHRVSVAKEMGAKSIQGYVTEITSRVPLTPETDPNELIIKSEYVAFLERTQIDRIRPEANLWVTAPGQYENLEEHIAVHRYYMGLEQKREISPEKAVADWYDNVYLPVVQLITKMGLQRDFPARSDTDLYLWIADHQAALERKLGDQVDSRRAAQDILRHFSPRLNTGLKRVSRKVIDALIPDMLEAGPRAGEWREMRETIRRSDRLFSDILVAVNGKKAGWAALEQALVAAQREGARLRGLYVVRTGKREDSPEAAAIQAEFKQRCEAAGLQGKLVVTAGEIARKVTERAVWNDLVVVKLSHPIGTKPLEKISSGLRNLILRCPQPILIVTRRVSPLQSAMLAFDGSPKAKEALYVAAYLAGQWKTRLVVVTIVANDSPAEVQQAAAYAKEYLEGQGIRADYAQCKGPIAPALLVMAEETQCDWILMGGYGNSPVFNLLSDDVVDQILRGSSRPVLLCR